MNIDAFAQQIQSLDGCLANLYQDAIAVQPEAELLTTAFQELATTTQMLETATKQLSQQTQKLAIAQARVRAEYQRYQDLFEFMPSAYLVTDTQGKIQEANRAASQLFNLQKPFLINKLLVCFIPVKDRQDFRCKLNQLGKSEFKYVQEWRLHIQPRHSEPFYATITVASLYDVKRNLTGWRWIVRDIAEVEGGEEQRSSASLRGS